MRPAEEFRHAITDAGLTAPDEIVPDGAWHRFASNGDREDDAGWYRFFPDGMPAGSFGCFRSGITQKWCSKSDRQMSETERAEYRRRIEETRRQRDHEEQRRHTEAAIRARAIWDGAAPALDSHPYLQKKRVHPYGIGIDEDNRLIIPILIDNAIVSVQFIDKDGVKTFLPGGKVKGGCFTIGEEAETETVLITEGFATAASLNQAIKLPVVVAFFAGNLFPVAQALRTQYPTDKILICGDNDQSGVGQKAAREAAMASGGVVAIPQETGTDWNDIAVTHGLPVVTQRIMAALEGRPLETEASFEPPVTPLQSPCILDDIHTFLGRFVAYPSEHAHIAHTLWVAHTHLMDAWESTPRLAFLSPEPGSGKTRAMELTETLVPRPVEAVNVTSAYLFRKISDSDGLPTVLHDEIDTVFGPRAKDHEEIRGAINAGHRRGASAGRCVVKGKQIETEELPAFCAVAIAGLGNLPDTILSRSVIIRMRRRGPSEEVQPYRRRVHAPQGYQLRNRLAAWATQIRPMLDTYPPMPDGITDRNADVWESLLSVADAAGGSWPERARVSAVSLVSDALGGQPSLGLRLLGDLRTVFGDCDAMWTAEILVALVDLEESPWGDLKGKPLDARRLAHLLRPYEVLSKQVRIGEKSQKGYTKESLWDVWSRYLSSVDATSLGLPPRASETSETSVTDGDGDLGLLNETSETLDTNVTEEQGELLAEEVPLD